jgi:hypothetical protein
MTDVGGGFVMSVPGERTENWMKGLTYIDLVQMILPGLTDKEADYVLWNETAFPFNGVYAVRRQLEDVAKETNGEIYT